MTPLNLPPCELRTKKTANGVSVFDALRAKFVALTPEERVRQHFVRFLINHKGYPKSLIANEIQIRVEARVKRCDTVVYGRTLNPLAIVEYKAPDVVIGQRVFEQIARYNYVLRVPCLMVSNGIEHYCCVVDYVQNSIRYLADIPTYDQLTSFDLNQ